MGGWGTAKQCNEAGSRLAAGFGWSKFVDVVVVVVVEGPRKINNFAPSECGANMDMFMVRWLAVPRR